jgi:hypothetical protein
MDLSDGILHPTPTVPDAPIKPVGSAQTQRVTVVGGELHARDDGQIVNAIQIGMVKLSDVVVVGQGDKIKAKFSGHVYHLGDTQTTVRMTRMHVQITPIPGHFLANDWTGETRPFAGL